MVSSETILGAQPNGLSDTHHPSGNGPPSGRVERSLPRTHIQKELVLVVLAFLVIMLIGSIASLVIIPPFLHKIERTGRVDFYGIKFL